MYNILTGLTRCFNKSVKNVYTCTFYKPSKDLHFDVPNKKSRNEKSFG